MVFLAIVFIGCLLFCLLITFLVLRFACMIVTVRGQSMSPTLQARDRVLVWRYWPRRWLRHGQIVIIQQVGGSKKLEPFIKRVVGLPGDTLVTSLADLPEHLCEKQRGLYDEQGKRTWHIPADHLFVRGDYSGSIDSTSWGPIAATRISGVMIWKLKRREHELPPITLPLPVPGR